MASTAGTVLAQVTGSAWLFVSIAAEGLLGLCHMPILPVQAVVCDFMWKLQGFICDPCAVVARPISLHGAAITFLTGTSLYV